MTLEEAVSKFKRGDKVRRSKRYLYNLFPSIDFKTQIFTVSYVRKDKGEVFLCFEENKDFLLPKHFGWSIEKFELVEQKTYKIDEVI